MLYISLAGIALLITAHMLVERMHFLEQDDWRCVGAGVAMSYVFLDILPHLSSEQYAIRDSFGAGIGAYLAHHAYLLALAGFVLYFGLAVFARLSRPARGESHMGVYLLAVALAVYCFLIGYLVGEQPDHRYEPVIIFAVAMAVHFVGLDHTLHEHYPGLYSRVIRYLFAMATFAGWLLGAVTTVPDIVFAMVFSFVVGAIIIVAFVYELVVVKERQQYWQFVLGVVGFSALLLVYEALANTDLSA